MTMNDERLVAIPFFGEGDQLLDMFLGRQDMAVERLGNVADPDVEMALWIDLGRARDERLDNLSLAHPELHGPTPTAGTARVQRNGSDNKLAAARRGQVIGCPAATCGGDVSDDTTGDASGHMSGGPGLLAGALAALEGAVAALCEQLAAAEMRVEGARNRADRADAARTGEHAKADALRAQQGDGKGGPGAPSAAPG